MADKIRVGGVCGLAALICVIVSLAINNISGYSYIGTALGLRYSLTCRWMTFDGCFANVCVNGVKYSDYCDNENAPDGDWCTQRNIGSMWISMLLIALILSTIASLSVFLSHLKRAQGYVRWLFLSSCICLIVAASAWIGASDNARLCYDGDASGLYMGGSLILVVIAIILNVFAFACTFRLSKDTDYQAMV